MIIDVIYGLYDHENIFIYYNYIERNIMCAQFYQGRNSEIFRLYDQKILFVTEVT